MYDTDMAYPLAATFIIIYIPDDLVTDCIIDLQPSWHLFGKSKKHSSVQKCIPHYLEVK